MDAEAVMAAASSMDPILRAVVTIGVLVFFAKIFASVFSSMKLPSVIGELLAGVVFSPYALGTGIVVFGEPLVVLNDYVNAFAEIGAIMLLFSMGLEMGLTSLRETGIWAVLIASIEAPLSFIIGYEFYKFLGHSETTALFLGAVMVATSLTISAKVLEDLDMLRTDEGTLLVNAAAIDDILGVAMLTIVCSILTHGEIGFYDVAKTVFLFFFIWIAMVGIGAYLIPRMIERFMALEAEGAVEAAAIASAFILAALAGGMGLSPIIGAYAAGMAAAESKALPHIKEFIRHINTIFSPIFFTVVGARMNLGLITDQVILGILLMTALAMMSKFVGCFTGAMLKLRNLLGSARVAIGMIPRGELGLIIANLALSRQVINEVIYVEVVGMVILTSIIAPVLLAKMYRIRSEEAEAEKQPISPIPPPPKPELESEADEGEET